LTPFSRVISFFRIFDPRGKRPQVDLGFLAEYPSSFFCRDAIRAFTGVRPLENHVDHVRIDGKLIFPDLVQEVFQSVRQFPYVIEVEETGHPLDRMKGPENGVHAIFVLGVLLEVQDVHFDLVDVLETFYDEIPEQGFILEPRRPIVFLLLSRRRRLP